MNQPSRHRTSISSEIVADAHRSGAARVGKIIPHVWHRNGERVVSFDKSWRAACKAAGCPGRLLHDFRRTSVRNLVRSGTPDTVAMKLTGHKTRAIFDRYNITSETDQREAVRRLSNAKGTKKGQNSISAAS